MNRYNLGLFNSGTYIPFACDIAAISQAEQAVVTTDQDHAFVVGSSVQFFIPPGWGMRQIDRSTGNVLTVIDVTSFSVNINTLAFDPFVVPGSPTQQAQVLPVGDQNFGRLSPGGVPVLPLDIPGSFINEYP